MPLFSPDLLAFVDGPNSVLFATQDGSLRPTSTRGLCVLPLDDRDGLAVWVPAAIAGRALSDLERDPRIAITASRATTHRTWQFKGRVTATRPLNEAERPALHERFERFVEECRGVGLPRRLLDRVVLWPCVALHVKVAEVFEQSPGPGAGQRWAPCP